MPREIFLGEYRYSRYYYARFLLFHIFKCCEYRNVTGGADPCRWIFNEHRLYGWLTKDRPSGIPFARNLPWTIVRGRFDKLPNNCQMLENNKVDADTGKKLSPESEQSEAFTTFVKRVRTVVRTRQWLRFPDIFVPVNANFNSSIENIKRKKKTFLNNSSNWFFRVFFRARWTK